MPGPEGRRRERYGLLSTADRLPGPQRLDAPEGFTETEIDLLRRLQKPLCVELKNLTQRILVSDTFAQHLDQAWRSHGSFELRNIGRPIEILSPPG
jgi:hypothetical protein